MKGWMAVVLVATGLAVGQAGADQAACGAFPEAVKTAGESQERIGGYLGRGRTDLACMELEDMTGWAETTETFFQRCGPWLAERTDAASRVALVKARQALRVVKQGTEALSSRMAGICQQERQCEGEAESLRQIVVFHTDEVERALAEGNKLLACSIVKYTLRGALSELTGYRDECRAEKERHAAGEAQRQAGKC